jgi:1-acyl-sn-glycerol-3-phosphate acyltransferase
MNPKYARIRRVLTFLFNLLTRVEVSGVENIPLEGGLILALNHLSRLDTPVLGITCPRRVYGFVAKKYQRFPPFRWFLNSVEVIWVSRSEFDRQALLQAFDVLENGAVLGLAPEGTRSNSGTLLPGKPGVAFLAARAGVPIVPVGLTGTAQALPSLARLRRQRIRVVYGKSFHLPKEGRLSSDELEEATELIMRRIAALLPPEYRGVYADAIPEGGMA